MTHYEKADMLATLVVENMDIGTMQQALYEMLLDNYEQYTVEDLDAALEEY